ncbi:MAG: hypothetical protein ACOC3B_02925, partial [Bacillota bacterium]
CRKEPTIQLTNKDKNILIEVNEFLNQQGMDYSIYSGEDGKRPEYDYKYYRMKIYNREFIKLLRKKYNWKGQREEKRYYPTVESERQEIEFLRYYIADQGTFDYHIIKKRKRKRYRIYGHCSYIDYLNHRISQLLGVRENKPQPHGQSNKMMILYYQSQKDVDIILDFINQG